MSARFRLDGREETLDPATLSDDERRRIARDAEFLWPVGHPEAGQPMPRAVADQMRAHVTTASRLPPPSEPAWSAVDPDVDDRPWLIPALWPWGTIPTFAGAKGAGKSTTVTDLVGALSVPGRRFLDYFEPTTFDALTVWVINSETPKRDFEDALLAAGVSADNDATVFVDHLERIGGPRRFDLTDPANFDEWAARMVECFACDGTDFSPPDVLIVDGVTAILHDAGKRADDYGLWYAAFRRLIRYTGIPNALVTAHTTLDGTHLLGGVEAQAGSDGLWNLDNRHRFAVRARLGGVKVAAAPIELGPDNRLRLRTKGGAAAVESDETTARIPEPSIGDLVLSWIADHPGATGSAIRVGVPVDDRKVDAAVVALLGAGLIERERRQARGGGWVFRVPRTGHDDALAADGKASA
jgi:hypothetical protein